MTKLPLALAISALLTPALVLAQNADDHPHPETKELDRVQVTASPLRSAIDDVARPISVLAGAELDARKAGTLGQTLEREAGVQSSFFGAGVGRPIIRGQEGARVQTLSGGMSSADVSTVSADHAVSIEPFLADQIEVLRGPAVLLYGSGAIAGAVNVVDGRIPSEPVGAPLKGRAEARFNDNDDGKTGALRLDGDIAGTGLSWHLDGFRRDTHDYAIPGYAFHAHLIEEDLAEGDSLDEFVKGKVPNSALETQGAGAGLSWFGERGWNGAVGVQYGTRDFQAEGDEAFVPASRSRDAGLFVLQEREFGAFKLELGARHDRVRIASEVAPERTFSANSMALGGIWKLGEAWHLSLNLDRAQRAPTPEELLSDGPHVATGTYEIGDAALDTETARNIDLGLHLHSGRFEGKLSLYRNRYDGYIYLRGIGAEIDGLPAARWSQGDAEFRGWEAEATVDLVENASGLWTLRTSADRVQAELDGGAKLPRIAPARVGAELLWERQGWSARFGGMRVSAQDDVAAGEEPTAGYTLVNANVTYHWDQGDTGYEVFLDGRNLADAEARAHTSFLKEIAPLPGRALTAGFRVFF